jgi:hypothetical protein
MLDAYRILEIDELEAMVGSLQRAPLYESGVQRPLERVIGAIHGLPSLHRGKALSDFEVYVGRTRADPEAIRDRWLERSSQNGHLFGAVLFSLPPERARDLERAALRIIMGLKKRRRLCVGNANVCPSGGGASPRGLAIIYMTWSKAYEGEDPGRPGAAELRDVAREVAERVALPRPSIERAIMRAKSPATFRSPMRFRDA